MEHDANSELITVSLNKETKTFSNKPFGDTSVFPVTLVDQQSGIKVVVDYDPEIKEFVCDVDGKPFECLIYQDAGHPDNKEVKTLTADILINGKNILKGTMNWQPKAL